MKGAALAAAGMAGLAAAILSPHLRVVGLAVALVCFLLGGSVLSRAGRIVPRLSNLVGTAVRVEVWGQPLEAGRPLQLHSTRSIGAGLHLFLRSSPGDSPRDLKIAQPGVLALDDGQLTIDRAAYVSLAGKKLARTDDEPALRLSWPASTFSSAQVQSR